MGVGREDSQARKEGKAEAIDAVAPLTQFFIPQPHHAEKFGGDRGKGKIGPDREESQRKVIGVLRPRRLWGTNQSW